MPADPFEPGQNLVRNSDPNGLRYGAARWDRRLRRPPLSLDTSRDLEPFSAASEMTARANTLRLGVNALRRQGLAETVRILIRLVKPLRYSEHIYRWYALDIGDKNRAHPELDGGLVFRRGDLRDMSLLEQLPRDPRVATTTRWLVNDRLDAGAALWIVTEGTSAAFRCFVFRRSAPQLGSARLGDLELPDDVVLLEDSITSPAFRGRAIAPAAWAMIADTYAQEGVRWMVTKVDVTNVVSSRAVERAGFREVATMQVVRRDWRTRVRVAFPAPAGHHRWLTAANRG